MKTQRNPCYHAAIMLALLLPVCPRTTLMAVEFDEPIILESPEAQFEGYFGASIAWVPDVNNDGIVDIVISASFENTGGRSSDSPGRVYVFDGATFEVLHQLRSPNEKPDSQFGGQVAGIGDLNGNGSGEVIAATTGAGESRAYVFDGATEEVIHTLNISGSLSAVPDVNGDGLPEIAVGNAQGPNNLGFVRIYDGASGAILKTLNSTNGNFDFFGWSIAGVADTNGNGGGDIVVGDWGADQAFLYDGTTGELLRSFQPPRGGAGGFGRSVSGLQDANGDGRGDVLAGVAGTNKAYIYDGATGSSLGSVSVPAGDTPSNFGWVVSEAQDVTGDGLSDIFIGGFYGADENTGNAYLFDGATGDHLMTFPDHDDFGGGHSIAGIPDVNGDGKGEVLVGNWSATASNGAVQAGHVSLYLSTSTAPQLEFLGFEGAAVRLGVSGREGRTVTIQASSDLESWDNVDEITLGAEPMEVSDPAAGGESTRFYRAVQ